jgi:hypothetical protein
MADITLSDYAGYIFLEIIKAREMADAYSRQVAARYAEDEVLKHFSTPRFKIPKMNLTIPVLISGAKFSQVMRFNMTPDQFVDFINARLDVILKTIRVSSVPIFQRPRPPVLINLEVKSTAKAVAAQTSEQVQELIKIFYERLAMNTQQRQPDILIREMWGEIFQTAVNEQKLVDLYKQQNPNNELFEKSLLDIGKEINTNTVIASTRIENLLIDPETNVVKNGSNETSVFTIQAELTEEGFFIKSVKDNETGGETMVVEFE